MRHHTDGPPQPPGILQVAALSGFSAATVSRALRGLPGVSADTRQRVQDAARQLHYRPSPFAAALAGGRTGAVGLLAPPDAGWIPAAMIRGAQHVLQTQGFDLILLTRPDPDGPSVRRVDGLLSLSPSPAKVPVAPQARTIPTVPTVAIGAAGVGPPTVTVDDAELGRLATTFLIDLGHRAVTFIGAGSPGSAAAERASGYHRAMRTAGLCPEQVTPAHRVHLRNGQDLMSAADPANPERVTAVVTADDEQAIAVLLTAGELGVGVRADLSIVTLGDDTLGGRFGLTAAAGPPDELGRAAATTLLRLIAGEPPPDGPVTIEPLLIEWATTGPPPTRTRPAGCAGAPGAQ